MFPELDDYKGQDIIVTNGKTLLGADDKGGVAAIIAAMKYLKRSSGGRTRQDSRRGLRPTKRSGPEPTTSMSKSSVANGLYDRRRTDRRVGIRELQCCRSQSRFQRAERTSEMLSDKMLNASLLAVEFASWLPVAQRPEHTTGYEGFFHLTGISGTVEEASLFLYHTRPCAHQALNGRKSCCTSW